MSALSVEAGADEVQLAISATNELSADIVDIAATKITYKAAYTDSSGETPVSVPRESVADALNNIQSISSADINSLFSAS